MMSGEDTSAPLVFIDVDGVLSPEFTLPQDAALPVPSALEAHPFPERGATDLNPRRLLALLDLARKPARASPGHHLGKGRGRQGRPDATEAARQDAATRIATAEAKRDAAIAQARAEGRPVPRPGRPRHRHGYRQDATAHQAGHPVTAPPAARRPPGSAAGTSKPSPTGWVKPLAED